MSEMLVQPAELAEQLGLPGVVVVDCRFDLLNPAAGRQAWEQGHIPGAFYADLDRDLAAPVTATSGRHPLPDPAGYAALLGSWSVMPDTLVVAYDSSGGAIAARLWWLLRWVGHERAAILDGGLPAWQAAGLPVDQSVREQRVGAYPVQPGAMPVIGATELQAGLAEGNACLLDARDAARFAGKVEPLDTAAGHVPGATNRPFQANLGPGGRFRAPAELWAEFAELAAGGKAMVSMCGSGVTACHNLFALQLAGLPANEVALYAGSWSEWIRDGKRPVATGDD
jgi:thiosulfate/3-mercaptopyruvate sulfurtransferase